MTFEPSFENLFQISPQASEKAHGRVNLMGEHTDYNDGFVLPTIIPQYTTITLAIDPEHQNTLDVFSRQYAAQLTRSFTESCGNHWSDYLLACIQQLQQQNIQIPSLKVLVESTVPIGAGVSSSAALEIAFLKALRSLLNLELTDLELAKIAQQSESEGIGMPCGIMDQMVSILGKLHTSFFLDTRDLTFEQIPLPTSHCFAVVNSGVVHQLANSDYKTRRKECETAAQLLQLNSLRDANFELMQTKKFTDLPQILQRRSHHVITENQRVLDCVKALKQNRIAEFGQLMNESHLSQKNDFQVTVPETDRLCELALKHGAMGARQTGGGFGGAIAALLPNEILPTWWQAILNDYPKADLICVTLEQPQSGDSKYDFSK